MLIKHIKILDEITDIENDNVDVYVECEDGYNYTVSIATTKNLLERMDERKSNFSKPADLFIIVRKLTLEIITEAIEAYAEDDGFWLKLHHFSSNINNSVFDELQAKQMQHSIESNLLSGLDKLEYEINKLEKLDDAQKSNLIARIGKLAELFL